ncbi:hypothetical protein PGT21_003123 [Puccinia graminis f. sp. tritici]|uniref:Uncharacterized protein n=1 Tax=Puccinia graminis f. sp. tritici TaxID=56615 RepID=A0A5B0LIP2_PUCGR|nr:hypothetical protein PGT21_003123 [Puccinia graminis f. sp. tritici]
MCPLPGTSRGRSKHLVEGGSQLPYELNATPDSLPAVGEMGQWLSVRQRPCGAALRALTRRLVSGSAGLWQCAGNIGTAAYEEGLQNANQISVNAILMSNQTYRGRFFYLFSPTHERTLKGAGCRANIGDMGNVDFGRAVISAREQPALTDCWSTRQTQHLKQVQ